MANPIAAIAAGASLVSGVLGLGGSRKAKKAARRAAAEAARQEKLVTEERLRQLLNQEAALRGTTIARQAGAGGVVNQGSILQILAEQANEFAIERRITESVGASKVKQALDQGAAAARQFRAQGLAALFAGIGEAASTAYGAGLFKKKG
jgi:hypothetical protein